MALVRHHVQFKASNRGGTSGVLWGSSGRCAIGRRWGSAIARLQNVEIPLLFQAEQLVENFQDALRLRVSHTDHAHILSGAIVVIEVLDHLLNQLHGVLGRADNHRVGANVRSQTDGLPHRGVDFHFRALGIDARDLLEIANNGGLLSTA